MEILFIWKQSIRRNKSKKDMEQDSGWNFGGEFLFNMLDHEMQSLKLDVKQNNNFIPGLFSSRKSEKSLKNITAIIGKNGSGKTQLIDFIIESLVINEKSKPDHLLIFQKEKELYIYHNLTTPVDFSSLSDAKIKHTVVNILIDNMKKPDNLTVIHFSNIFDGTNKRWINVNPRTLERSGFYDISTNYLCKHPVEDKHGVLLQHIGDFDKFRALDFQQQINFVTETRNSMDYHDFKIPNRINISPLNLQLEWAFEGMNDDMKRKIEILLGKIEGNNDNKGYKKNTRGRVAFQGITHFHRTVLYVFIYQLNSRFLSNADDTDRENIINFLESTINGHADIPDFNFIVQSWFKAVSHYFLHELELSKNNKYKSLILFVDKLLDLLLFVSKHESYMRNSYLSIPISAFNDFWKIYSFFYTDFPFFNLQWRNMSSGEIALMNLYARFHSIKSKKLNKNLLIIIDEGDLYLHPQWQKKFVKRIIEFLTSCFPEFSVQLILTSHSPILLSDLPMNNVIMLGREIVKEETFAANIHNLFSHTFFIQEGLMGDFARDQINEVIRTLLSANYDHNEYQKAKKINKQIGESIIQYKISQLIAAYEEKFDLVDIDERILKAERSLQELLKLRENGEMHYDGDKS